MDIRKISLLFHTLKYLKFVQVYYRIYYLIRNKLIGREPKRSEVLASIPIFWNGGIRYSNRYSTQNSFEFLNIQHQFPNEIDWNFDAHGKLWTYNLNYFDFLNQSDMSKELGLKLIQDYVEKEANLKDGKEPYPISLRLINWVKFLSEHKIKENKIDAILYHHTRTLEYNLEYHLLANHLLENAFALLFGAYYFQDVQFYSISKKLLVSQLNEQILKDGAHYELSPMYHQILLHRLLDCIHLVVSNSDWKNDELINFMKEKASEMRSWLENITYQNGDIPMVSDSAYHIAPTTNELLKLADDLNIKPIKLTLKESGYRKITQGNFELFMDVGNIQPSYQPGHTHSDTFHFELYKDSKPILVDLGVSTYEKNKRRQQERSTLSHNTVIIDNENQTEVWGGFRVGRRAKVTIENEKEGLLSATHDGYKRKGYLHQRTFEWNDTFIQIKDDVSTSTKGKAQASFHLDSSIKKPEIDENKIVMTDEKISIIFDGYNKIQIENYNLPQGYNNTKLAYKIIVTFDQNLVTQICL